jgi:hypothetical protein
MKRGALVLAVGVLALAFAACSPPKPPQPALCTACEKAAPEKSGLQLNIPGETQMQALSVTGGPALGQLSDYYNDTVQMTRSVNSWALGMLGWIDQILSYPPNNHANDYCIWGPFVPDGLSPVQMQFKMRQQSSTTFDYYWEERPKNTDGAFRDVWWGDMEPVSSTVRRGIGVLHIDFTAANQLDPTSLGTGAMDMNYDTYTNNARRIELTFTNFSPDGVQAPADQTYQYYNAADNSGEFIFSTLGNIDPSLNLPNLETFAYHTLWLGSGAGNCHQTVTGGDLDKIPGFPSPLEKIDGYECWDENFLLVYYEQTAYLQNGQTLAMATTLGDASACVEVEPPPA